MKFTNLYQEDLKEIIEAKMEICAPRGKGEITPPRKVISIMEALCKSVEQSKGSNASEPKAMKSNSIKSALKKSAAKEAVKKKQVA